MPARPPSRSAPRTALVLGATSDIAIETMHRLVADGLEQVVLACRRPDELAARFAERPLGLTTEAVRIVAWDATDVAAHAALVDDTHAALGAIDLVLCAVGSLGHGAGITASPDAVAAMIDANFRGPASALTEAARCLLAQGHGSIVVISSVAGLRGRKSNYVYGSSKGGLDTFTCGLADALHGSGVAVHLIRPGFVHTRMTTGLAPAPFASRPEQVADAIATAVRRPQSSVVHVPRLLGPLFAGLRAAPRPLWRRIAGDR